MGARGSDSSQTLLSGTEAGVSVDPPGKAGVEWGARSFAWDLLGASEQLRGQ